MVRILRIVLALIGVGLVIASSALTWVNVDIDTEAFAELAEEAAEGAVGDAVEDAVGDAVGDAVDGEIDAAELVDDASEAIEALRERVPDRLLDATINGQNSYDLFGLGFLLVGLALATAAAVAFWAIRGARWLRWLGVLLAFSLLILVVLTPLSIIATDAALDNFLPENWKPFSPSFDVTTAPLGAIGGSVLISLGFFGRAPRRTNTPAAGIPAATTMPTMSPPPPPADMPFTN